MINIKHSYILQNVRLLDGELVDIIIKSRKIDNIVKAGSAVGDHLVNCSGLFISSGWIDLHVHAFPEFDPYGDEIDEIGIKQGVTTIVDAGSCGADRIANLMELGKSSKTNVLAFLNISKIGLKQTNELSNLEWIDRKRVLDATKTYKDFIVGLKARISRSVVGDLGIEPLLIAQELSKLSTLPVMVHIGSSPPHIEEIVSLLKTGDIITHYLNGKANNLFTEEGKPLPVLVEAVKRGVHLDVGHGTASFSFKVAEAARENGIPLGTISTDIYRGNRLNGPVYSMANVLTKFLYLGYSLKEVVESVTVKTANWLNKPELGRIQIGGVANLTLFSIETLPTTLIDSEGEQRVTNQKIEAKGVVINGEFIKC